MGENLVNALLFDCGREVPEQYRCGGNLLVLPGLQCRLGEELQDRRDARVLGPGDRVEITTAVGT